MRFLAYTMEAVNLGAVSAAEHADIETSSEEYASRFAGEAGAWLLEVQLRGIVDLLGADGGIDILDVGGGHGQLANPLSAIGHRVTVLGSAAICAARLQIGESAPRCQFQVADLLNLPFPPRSFSAVLCVRFLSHCAHWSRCISELCRVSDGPVIIDYPRRSSFNVLYWLLFSLKRKLEGNTRHFTVFSDDEIELEFRKHGFVLERRIGQFMLPMVLHRVLGNRGISEFVEGALGLLRLNQWFGSPVLARFVRAEAARPD